MTFDEDLRKCVGAMLHGTGDEKIGKIGQLYLDDTTGRPEWATVATGLFGRRESFVPLENAWQTEDGVFVPFSKDQIKGAPSVEPDHGHITPEEEQELDEYYRRSRETAESDTSDASESERDSDTETAVGSQANRGRRSTDRTDSADGTSTDSDDSDDAAAVAAGTGAASGSGEQSRSSGEPRLRRWVETEYESVEVPVQRERVAFEDDPDRT